MRPFMLPLEMAFEKLGVSQSDFRETTKLTVEQTRRMSERGVSLDEAEAIGFAYGMHPSEIWGENWVDAVLTLNEWGGEYDDEQSE